MIAPPSFGSHKSMRLEEVALLPRVMREEGSGTRRQFEEILLREGLDPQGLAIAGLFGSTDAIKQAVKAGMGLSVISRRAVLDELKCGLLREIRIRKADMKRRFFVVTHRKRTLPHIYKSFLEHILPGAR